MSNSVLGQNIKKFRKQKKLSQTDLGKALPDQKSGRGKSLRTIQKYESGEITPPLDVIEQIAEALEVDVSELLGIDESERMKFESDFKLEDFDPYILKVFNEFKENLTNSMKNTQISNSELMHNMVIDYLAKYKAEVKAYNRKTFYEFASSDGKLITGKQQFDLLFERYYKNIIKELRSSSIEKLSRIFVYEDLENPTPGFLKMIHRHIESFGGIDLSPQIVELYNKHKNELSESTKEGE